MRSRRIPKLCFSLLLLLAIVTMGMRANAESYTKKDIASDKNLQTIRQILELPDDQIDLAKVKLTIDHMIDPSISVANTLKQLDAMAAEVKARFPSNPSSRDKLETLRAYLFDKGNWNFRQPFRYDLEDPYGDNARNKLLPTYLATRKGNCITMPLLLIILGQKVGIDITGSTAPSHFLAKFRDEMGVPFNIEATSGGHSARDVWLQEQFHISDKALTNGIYLQTLSKKETVVMILDTLNEFYDQQGQPAHCWVLAELELKYYPKDVSAMLHISAANADLRKAFFAEQRRKHPEQKNITVTEEIQKDLVQLEGGAWYWQSQARALGWRPESKDDEIKYRQRLKNAKLEQN